MRCSASRERRAAAVCTRAPLKACTNLSLSRGPRPGATPRDASAGGLAQLGELVALSGVRLLPPAPRRGAGRAVLRVRTGPGPPTAPVDAAVPAGRGRRHRCTPRRAAPGRGSRRAPPRSSRAARPRGTPARGRRGGWSARRAAGPQVGARAAQRARAATAGRPTARPPRRSRGSCSTPRRCAASSVRRSASQAACAGRLFQRRVEPGCDRGVLRMPCHQVRVPLHLPRHRVQRVERLAQHLTDGGPGVEATVLREVAEVGRERRPTRHPGQSCPRHRRAASTCRSRSRRRGRPGGPVAR